VHPWASDARGANRERSARNGLRTSYSRAVPSATTLTRLRNAPAGRRIRELAAFGVVGGVCFLVDVAVFQFLYAHAGADAVLSKLLATTVSMTAAFAGHRFWSFSHRARPGLRREYLRFTGINGATLLLGLGIVAFVRYPLGQESAWVLQAANVLSIGVGTVLRYLAYRQWVFPAMSGPSAEPVQRSRRGRNLGPQTGPQPSRVV
jgi:putative flippase GtrA